MKKDIRESIANVRRIIYEFESDRSIPLAQIKSEGGKVDINHLLTLIKDKLIELADDL